MYLLFTPYSLFLTFSADYKLTQRDELAHCVIEYSKKDDILVQIDDISIEQRYLVCLLDEREWLDDEVSILANNEIFYDY
jgi:hypothetical protein